MKRTARLFALATAIALVLPVGAAAQRANQMILYSDIGFRGRSITVSGAQTLVNVPFTVRSVRIANREAWQVCSLPAFQGQCNTFQENQGNIGWTVRSARPSSPLVTAPPPPPPT